MLCANVLSARVAVASRVSGDSRGPKSRTAFDKCVLTGAIINSNYIEPLRFIEDARSTVLDRVRDVMGRYNSVKVNTTLKGEFVAGDKVAVKTIATKNHPLLITSDLREWYNRYVIDAILAGGVGGVSGT
ncbi:mannosyl-oligosaccharide alpha-mannosidase isoform 2 [Lasius niger]|uniref:Mannosyl-oligosaccharide alpha-mannosidase isoform 2 n=1 Tax=Lasius niger TaxID=67767 RepID=A0A0J7K203_LASNI|nr:mannosyl-oligosaccharide alpha-mannosidase isoform 2 [Lasius niger]